MLLLALRKQKELTNESEAHLAARMQHRTARADSQSDTQQVVRQVTPSRPINKRGSFVLQLSLALLLAVFARPSAVRADDIQERFTDAMEAVQAERLNTARAMLRELLADYPTLYRARLELARVDYLTRNFDAAEAQVTEVLNDPDLPPSVKTNLTAFLAQIRDDRRTFEKKHRWSGQVYGGAMYDSNVNFGVARDIVEIGGLNFQVLPGSKPKEDGAAVIDAGALHTYNPGWSFEAGEDSGFVVWQSQFNAYYRRYFEETDYNLGVATLRTGPAWVVPEKWSASIGLQLDQLWLGDERLALFTTLNPNVTWDVTNQTQLSAGFVITERNYRKDEDDGRDGRLYRGNLGFSTIYQRGILGLQGGIGYANFDGDDNRFSYTGPEGFLGGTWNAWERGSLYTSVGYRKFKFKAPEPLFPEARDDDEYRLIVGARHIFAQTWMVRGEWIYTNNKSNIALYDFDRNQISLGLAKNW